MESFNWNFNFYRTSRSHGYVIEPRVMIRPTAAFSAEFGHLFDRDLNDAQWVTSETRDDRTRYVFGRLNQKTSSMDGTGQLHSDAEPVVQVYAQPFVSSGNYAEFKEPSTPRDSLRRPLRSVHVYGRTRFQGAVGPHHERDAWEYKPGSTLFVVGAGREGTGDVNGFRYGRDLATSLLRLRRSASRQARLLAQSVALRT